MNSVLVTGGSRGIGLAIAYRLARNGRTVVVLARRGSDGLQAATAELRSHDGAGSLNFKAADLAEVERLGGLVKDVRDEYGPIAALVNNAGIGTSGLLAMTPDTDIARLMQVNVLSPIILTKYVVRSMMSHRRGQIVNVASIVGATGFKGLAPYSATKSALVGFTRSLAREVGSLGVTVNAVAPGFIDTEMTADLAPGDRETIARRSALKRMADAEDVAAAVEFLLSPAARNITGTVLTVDAGGTA